MRADLRQLDSRSLPAVRYDTFRIDFALAFPVVARARFRLHHPLPSASTPRVMGKKKGGGKKPGDAPAGAPASGGRGTAPVGSNNFPSASSPRGGGAAPRDSTPRYLPTSRPFEAVQRIVLSRVAFFLLGVCGVVYFRSVPLRAIPDAFQDRVEHAIPPWLNSSMHLLNGLPALNTTHFENGAAHFAGAFGRGPSPGAAAREAGRTPHHPVVIVPGFISSGLELWRGLACGRHFFRQRMWGTPAMARAYLANRACWMQHMRLDPTTGLDPPGIKLRAVTGLEAVDWFVPGYFVWGKVIESLGEVGYDANMIHAATFDWRLSPAALEERDGYFTKLKADVETLVAIHGVPVAILAHSYGDQLTRYFLNWVETPAREGGGGGGRRWTAKHVAVYVDIAGPMLGIPKTVPSLLSGDMRDTAILGQLESLLGLEKAPLVGGLVSGALGTVAQTFRTWGSLWAMLPRGGVDIWGADDAIGAPDAVVVDAEEQTDHGDRARRATTADREPPADEPEPPPAKTNEPANESEPEPPEEEEPPLRHFLSVRREEAGADDASREVVDNASTGPADDSRYRRMTVVESLTLLFDRVGATHPRQDAEYRDVYFGNRRPASLVRRVLDRFLLGSEEKPGGDGGSSSRPSAPSPPPSPATRFGDPLSSPLPNAPGLKIFCLYGVGKKTERAYHYVHRPGQPDRPFALDVARHGGQVERGVTSVDGDGSIPLVSLGYMCASGWRGERTSASATGADLNPGNVEVKIREYPHRALPMAWGGGIQEGRFSGDHVNIMGNHEMIADVIEAVTGRGGELEERIVSDVARLAERVKTAREARRAMERGRSAKNGGGEGGEL